MSDQLRECPNPWCQREFDVRDTCRSVRGLRGAENRVVICPFCGLEGPSAYCDAEALAAWNTRPTSEREARLVEALKVCEQDRVRLYGDGQTLKDAISNQVDDALAAYSEVKQGVIWI